MKKVIKVTTIYLFIFILFGLVINIMKYEYDIKSVKNEKRNLYINRAELENRILRINEKLKTVNNYMGIGDINNDYEIDTIPETWTEIRVERLIQDHGINKYKLRFQNMTYPINIDGGYVAYKGCEFAVKRENKRHKGFDCSNPYDTSVMAMSNGIIIDVGFDNFGGNYIKISSIDIIGISFNYYHLEKTLVIKGEQVVSGQLVGIMGNTGDLSNGRHLHFEVIQNNKYINPFINSTWKNVIIDKI